MKDSVKLSIRAGAVLLAVVLAVGGFFVLRKSSTRVQPHHKITLGLYMGPHSSLVHVALANGYFRAEGLDVTVQEHVSGKAALNSLVEGKVDLATAAETPITLAALKGHRISVLATIFTSEKDLVLVARKEEGISTPRDLTGKKVGVPLGTTGEFFLDAFLALHSISKKNIEIIDVKPDEMVNALVTGRIDAASIWHPQAFQLQKELGERCVTFHGETICTETFNILVTQDYVRRNPDVAKGVLRALLRAEEFVRSNPSESVRIVSNAIKTDGTLLSQYWNIYKFKVSLEQSLIINLEDQARWVIKTNQTDVKDVPNFVPFIYLEGLKAVKPEAVSIIH